MLHHLITCYRIHILKISQSNHMFYMFLTFISILRSIGCYLLFNPKTHLLCIILNYKNLNLNN